MLKPTKKSQIKRNWHLFDAQGQILGRLASKITPVLMGKTKPYFVRNLDCGDHVVVINAKQVELTGHKKEEKKYYSYSGYPSGLKIKSFLQLQEKAPEKIIIHAVENMLPKNKLRDLWLKKLHVFAEEAHSYKDKFVPLRRKPRLAGMNAKNLLLRRNSAPDEAGGEDTPSVSRGSFISKEKVVKRLTKKVKNGKS